MDELAKQLSEIAPKAAQEILAWGLWKNWIGAIVGATLVVLCVAACFVAVIFYRRDPDKDQWIGWTFASAVFAAVGLPMLILCASLLHKIANYPMAYILSKVR